MISTVSNSKFNSGINSNMLSQSLSVSPSDYKYYDFVVYVSMMLGVLSSSLTCRLWTNYYPSHYA